MHRGFDAKAFVDTYSDAFERHDAAKVAGFYHIPCLSVRATGDVHVFGSMEELQLFFAQVLDAYAGEGMARFASMEPTLSELGEASIRFTCRWQMKRHDASVIREWQQTYLLQRGTDDWRIIASVFHQ